MIHEAKLGHLDGVRAFLERGLSINHANAAGETILSVAVESPENPVTAFCLAQGFLPATQFQDVAGGYGAIGDLALYRAVKAGRKDIVQRLLQLGAMADGGRNREFNPLAMAVSNGDRDLVKLLIGAGAMTDGAFVWSVALAGQPVRQAVAPLINIPIAKRDLPMLQQLLALHVAPIALAGESSLQAAVAMDWSEAVAVLLENGADPDQLGLDDQPLDRWVKSAAVRGLLQGARAATHFSNLSVADGRRVPCQQFVRKLFQAEIADLRELLARLPKNVVAARDDRGWTLAMYALDAGKVEVVPDLIAGGAPIDAIDAKGLTIAGRATAANGLRALEVLVAHKADLNVYGERGLPPLSIALREHNLTLATWLLDHGASAEPSGPVVRTPLMWAMLARDEDMVVRLLHAGANVKRSDGRGWPVVFYAARCGSGEVLQRVQNAGANLKDEVNRGAPLLLQAVVAGDVVETRALLDIGVAQSPAIVAQAVAQPEMLSLLDEYAHHTGEARARAEDYWRGVASLSAQAVGQHLSAESDQNFVGSLTPLQWSVDAGRADLIPLLLDHGADPNALGLRERTPALIAAVRSSRVGSDGELAVLVRLMFEHGANIDVAEEEDSSAAIVGGRTALLICIAEQKYETATQLLSLGADPESVDAQGRSAMDYLAMAPFETEASKVFRDRFDAARKKSDPLRIDDRSSPNVRF